MRRRNFTLVEMVVAAGLLLVILLLGGMMTGAVLKTRQTVAATERRLTQMQTIGQVFGNAVRNAVPFLWRDALRRELLLFGGESDRMTLSYLHPVGARENGALRFLRLAAVDGALAAEYRPWPAVTAEDWQNAEREILATGVKRIKLAYGEVDRDEIIWLDFWDTEEKKYLPEAILLTVEFEDGQSEVWLKRTAGAGRHQQFGNRRRKQP